MTIPGDSEYEEGLKAFRGFVPRVMGTRLEMLSVGLCRTDSENLWNEICLEAFSLNDMLDRFSPASEVSRLNSSVPFHGREVSSTLAEIIGSCIEYRERTRGLFDITRGRGAIRLEGTRLDMEGCDLDFGGFAKGWFMSLCQKKIAAAGVRDALVNFGNSTIMGMGRHPLGDSWPVEITDPFTGAQVAGVRLKDSTLSTSGNSPRYDGHITDPRSGQAVTGRKLAWVVSDNPLDAEVLSTAAMIADDSEIAYLRGSFKLLELSNS